MLNTQVYTNIDITVYECKGFTKTKQKNKRKCNALPIMLIVQNVCLCMFWLCTVKTHEEDIRYVALNRHAQNRHYTSYHVSQSLQSHNLLTFSLFHTIPKSAFIVYL